MAELWAKIVWLITQTVFDEILGILTAILSIIIAAIVFFSPKIKISSKILRGVNYSHFKEDGEIAWKFKIVNKSLWVSFFEFDVKLTGIKYKVIEDGTFTQHRSAINILASIEVLERYEPRLVTFIKRKINPKYTISYAYRPVTYVNLEEIFQEYDKLELSVKYIDSFIGRTHHTKRYFEKTIIQGDFTNDGRLNYVLPNKISDSAWKNHLEYRDKYGNLIKQKSKSFSGKKSKQKIKETTKNEK